MRAKILMVSDSLMGKALLRMCQQTISDIAIAFGHSFVMKDVQLDGPEAVSLAAEEAQAILAVLSEASLFKVFDAHIRTTTLELPEGLKDFSLLRVPDFPTLSCVSPFRPGLDAAVNAARKVLGVAGAREAMVWAVVSGDRARLWEEAVGKTASPYALSAPEALPLAAAVAKPLQFPQREHIFLADTASADLLLGLYRGLSGAGLSHSIYQDESRRVHLAGSVPGFTPRLFDALDATVAMLDESLGLKKEAGCLKASVGNVLASGWRAKDMDIEGNAASDEKIAALLGEQIDLAGSLMQRFPG
ncbi:MAG: hypothetical protein PHP07_00105 [Eubacteriales bacterium]|jgi:hypothetical protein|nr:hypothetical protein [Eubacteriales bacterium]MDD3571336.1 hypothetical protein [Eubacteriales bacterium]MDD4133929.1 hypothetical protein [Eubacteriales bacterium]